ncbi:MAG: YggS family pyridoxal phosphate-dependent enzyme [Acholeplasmataceae bacterium]|jgi:pyridoxal phosphate enzyme (YggS family)|nr:YggS family pyridoxal phosphate-dependent enzyme [Acholeplasmataceae bacterium]
MTTTICASKYFSSSDMRKLYQKGVAHFGENRVFDMLKKMDELCDLAITWHFIGHLQTNKVKPMIDRIDYLHTLDRLSLAEVIQKYATHLVKCFIQVNLTDEDQKSGISPDKLDQFLIEIKKYDKIEVIGLMTIGKDQDNQKTEEAFQRLDELAAHYGLKYKSMGMSDDYELALKHHATHLRIGRKFKELIDEEGPWDYFQETK